MATLNEREPIDRPRWGPAHLLGLAVAGVVLLLPAYVAATSLIAVLSTHQSVPYMDQWATVNEYRALLDHGLRFEDLWRQHNEHRILFPRIILLGDYVLTGGSNYLNTAAIFAIQAMGALLFLVMAREGGGTPLKACAAAVAAAGLFSLLQWENLVWGFQVQFVGVYCCAAWAIYVFCLGARDAPVLNWPRLGLAFALLAVASFSMANGVLAGAAMAAVAVIARLPLRAAAVALAAAFVLTGLYLHGFHLVAGHSPPSLALADPLAFASYVAVYLGDWRGLWGVQQAMILGFAGMAGVAIMAATVCTQRSRSPAQLALLGVALFVMASAGVTALGRLSFGLEQALSSRYVTPSAWFWAAQLTFWTLQAQARAAWWPKLIMLLPLGLAAHQIVFLQGQMFGVVGLWRGQVALGAEALLSGAADDEALTRLFPDPATPRELAAFLREHRLSIFAEPRGRWTGRPLRQVLKVAPRTECTGAFDAWTPAPGASGAAWRGAGWAWDALADQRVKQLVLVGGDGRIVGVGAGGDNRPDVPQVVPQVDNPNVGWTASARPPKTSVTAYAVLRDGRACEIGGKAVTTVPRSDGALPAGAPAPEPRAPGPA
ncbi:MAG: hypothetical protein Q8M88_13590 [Phenylobacterium sp.]|uniref:hypothetical protein n=1 Tax=Phenylobacterium sp. TaxID=1871053 RepID=UPI00273499D7|nr:hypothetical protein [Phenylobacterium sp.]MDP3175461.1 hypothetical protein [Phenylobacterium sp.]